MQPAEQTITRTHTDSTWIVKGDNLQNLSLQMNYLDEVLSKDGKEIKAKVVDRPYLGKGKEVSAFMGPESVYFPTLGESEIWSIKVSGVFDPQNNDAKSADDAIVGFAVIGKVASDLLKLSGDIAKAFDGESAQGPFLIASFIVRSVAGAAEIAKFFRDAQKDTIEQIEQAILPAVETIVTREIQESEFRSIKGKIHKAANQFETATKILSDANIDPDDKTPVRPDMLEKRVGRDGMQSVEKLLEVVSNVLAGARGATEIADERMPLWTLVAKMILAVELLRLFCFGDRYRQEALARLNLVYEYGKARLEADVSTRKAMIVGVVDNGLDGQPKSITAPLVEYRRHLAHCVDRGLGDPSQVLKGIRDAIFANTGKEPDAGPVVI
ncbi:MAG: hypothetical protein KGI75_21425 [Rhizobiaceae bacterium]|nr:hypothetical protein [Rhizobiaceae bacterium]